MPTPPSNALIFGPRMPLVMALHTTTSTVSFQQTDCETRPNSNPHCRRLRSNKRVLHLEIQDLQQRRKLRPRPRSQFLWSCVCFSPYNLFLYSENHAYTPLDTTHLHTTTSSTSPPQTSPWTVAPSEAQTSVSSQDQSMPRSPESPTKSSPDISVSTQLCYLNSPRAIWCIQVSYCIGPFLVGFLAKLLFAFGALSLDTKTGWMAFDGH